MADPDILEIFVDDNLSFEEPDLSQNFPHKSPQKEKPSRVDPPKSNSEYDVDLYSEILPSSAQASSQISAPRTQLSVVDDEAPVREYDLEEDLITSESTLKSPAWESTHSHLGGKEKDEEISYKSSPQPRASPNHRSEQVEPATNHHHGGVQSSSCNIYVGNMSWWTSDEDLINRIQNAGAEELKDIRFFEEKMNGKSKGFAYLSFTSEKAASAAVERLSSEPLHGKTLNVYPVDSKKNMSGTGPKRSANSSSTPHHSLHSSSVHQSHSSQPSNWPRGQSHPMMRALPGISNPNYMPPLTHALPSHHHPQLSTSQPFGHNMPQPPAYYPPRGPMDPFSSVGYYPTLPAGYPPVVSDNGYYLPPPVRPSPQEYRMSSSQHGNPLPSSRSPRQEDRSSTSRSEPDRGQNLRGRDSRSFDDRSSSGYKRPRDDSDSDRRSRRYDKYDDRDRDDNNRSSNRGYRRDDHRDLRSDRSDRSDRNERSRSASNRSGRN